MSVNSAYVVCGMYSYLMYNSSRFRILIIANSRGTYAHRIYKPVVSLVCNSTLPISLVE